MIVDDVPGPWGVHPDCHFGDHFWNGTSQCVRCYERLRCACGCYIREDNIETHLKRCPYYEAVERHDRQEIESSWL